MAELGCHSSRRGRWADFGGPHSFRVAAHELPNESIDFVASDHCDTGFEHCSSKFCASKPVDEITVSEYDAGPQR